MPQSLHGLLLATRRAGVLVQVGNLPDETRPVNLAPLVSKEMTAGHLRFNDEIDAAITLLSEPADRASGHPRTAFEEVNEAFAIAANPEISARSWLRSALDPSPS